MKEVRLSKVCTINPPKSKELSAELLCSFVPMDYVDEESGSISRMDVRPVAEVRKGYTEFREKDVIFAKITPCMENGKCAIAKNLINEIGFGSTEFHVLRANSKILPEWIYYYLRQERIRKQAVHWFRGTAGQQRVPSIFLEELQIPLPTLPEQKRITAVLDKADRLRQLRRYAIELGNSYLASVFLEMFGDPAYNPKNWPIMSVESCLSDPQTGIQTGPFGSSLKRHEYVDKGIPVWGINNLHENEFIQEYPLYITPNKYRELSKYAVDRGDILLSRAGTVGRLCVARPKSSPSIIGTNLIKISVDKTILVPEYFSTMFTYFGSRIGQLKMTGDEHAYSFINPRILRTLEIMVPPMKLQEKFFRITQGVAGVRAQQREALNQANQLFLSLLHRAFEVGL